MVDLGMCVRWLYDRVLMAPILRVGGSGSPRFATIYWIGDSIVYMRYFLCPCRYLDCALVNRDSFGSISYQIYL